MDTKLARAVLACALWLAPGCALLSKAEPLEVRYFAPAIAAPAEAAEPQPARRLTLGRISAAPHIDRRMVYRSTEQELSYRPTLRWTEFPDEYLRRALSQELFEARGITQVVSGVAPILTVELVAFEEVQEPKHVARVTVMVSLVDGKSASLARTFTVERPIADKNDPRKTVDALGEALSASVKRIASDVLARLPAEAAGGESVPAAPPAPAPALSREP